MVPDSAIAIESGDLIYDSVKKYALGTVQDVTLEPARRLSRHGNGPHHSRRNPRPSDRRY